MSIVAFEWAMDISSGADYSMVSAQFAEHALELMGKSGLEEKLVAAGFDLSKPIHSDVDVFHGIVAFAQMKPRRGAVKHKGMSIDQMRDWLRRGCPGS